MERLTRKKRHKVCDGGKHPTKYTSGHTFQEVVARLAAYEDTGLTPEEIKEVQEAMAPIPFGRFHDIMEAEREERLVVLEPATKEGVEKPPCFYNDMGQTFCLGFARGEYDDEPVDRCKECWYCESTREEAEAALKEQEG